MGPGSMIGKCCSSPRREAANKEGKYSEAVGLLVAQERVGSVEAGEIDRSESLHKGRHSDMDAAAAWRPPPYLPLPAVGHGLRCLSQSGRWRQCTVLAHRNHSSIRVHWDGFHREFDEWIDLELEAFRLRPPNVAVAALSPPPRAWAKKSESNSSALMQVHAVRYMYMHAFSGHTVAPSNVEYVCNQC
jgi:hypothetical protein